MPDLNVWLALTWANHMHSDAAWTWFSRQEDDRFFFCRFTQLGLLRLLTTSAVMSRDVLTIGGAWKVYDRWLEDSRVAIRPGPFELDAAFRAATRSVSRLSSPKALGDCYLLAVSQVTDATLVTFDRGLASACQKARQRVTLLEPRALAGG
ncbi:MAG: TA system VapC family ribonuclease toxin [Bryobacteraceae bacterium]